MVWFWQLRQRPHTWVVSLSQGRLAKVDHWKVDNDSAENDDDDKTEEEIIDEISKRKMDPELRMNALRLAIELEMWDESIKIGENTWLKINF